MGVPGFWDHMSKYAQKVKLADLYGKTLAVDGHSWMMESPNIKSVKNPKNGFLVTFYKRCLALRQNNIEPFIVFDKIPTIFDQHIFTEPGGKILQKKRTKRGGNISWNNTIFQDLTNRVNHVKELLSAMGVRYVEGGADGDAQCAQLEETGVADGCITSDLDYFLFGGRHMYKIDFKDNTISSVQHLAMSKLDSLNLNRNRLIALAILLGCDYVEGGIERVGIISALEILSEFAYHEDDHPISVLDRFAGYMRGELPVRATDSERKTRLRSSNIQIPHGFPNTDVYIEASCLYLDPRVEHLEEAILPEKDIMNFKRVSSLLHSVAGYVPLRPTAFRVRSKKQSILPEFFSNTRRRSQPVIEQCSKEDRTKCSQREWAALEKLKATAAAYSIGMKRKRSSGASSSPTSSTRDSSPRKRSRKAVVNNCSTSSFILPQNDTMTQSETSSIVCLD